MGSEREQWRKLDAEATPGPWKAERDEGVAGYVPVDYEGCQVWPWAYEEDMRFAYAARIGWPAAEAEVEQLRALLRQVRRELADLTKSRVPAAYDAITLIDASNLLGPADG
jgi:hypothetical protein